MSATGAASCLGAKCEMYKAMPTATRNSHPGEEGRPDRPEQEEGDIAPGVAVFEVGSVGRENRDGLDDQEGGNRGQDGEDQHAPTTTEMPLNTGSPMFRRSTSRDCSGVGSSVTTSPRVADMQSPIDGGRAGGGVMSAPTSRGQRADILGSSVSQAEPKLT